MLMKMALQRSRLRTRSYSVCSSFLHLSHSSSSSSSSSPQIPLRLLISQFSLSDHQPRRERRERRRRVGKSIQSIRFWLVRKLVLLGLGYDRRYSIPEHPLWVEWSAILVFASLVNTGALTWTVSRLRQLISGFVICSRESG